MSELFQQFLQDPTIVLDRDLLSRTTRRYVSKDIVQLVAPVKTPVTLLQTKEHMRTDDFDDDDDLTTSFIKGCSEWAEKILWHSFITQTWQMTMDSVPRSRRLKIRMPPLIDVTKVSSFDRDNVETTFADTNYFINDRGRAESEIILNDGSIWPTDTRDFAGFRVTYTAGYGVDDTFVPDSIKSAIKELVAVKYENREEEQDFRFQQAMTLLNQFMTPRL